MCETWSFSRHSFLTFFYRRFDVSALVHENTIYLASDMREPYLLCSTKRVFSEQKTSFKNNEQQFSPVLYRRRSYFHFFPSRRRSHLFWTERIVPLNEIKRRYMEWNFSMGASRRSSLAIYDREYSLPKKNLNFQNNTIQYLKTSSRHTVFLTQKCKLSASDLRCS